MPPVGTRDSSDLLVRIGYGACAVMALGALAPWAELGALTASGVDGPDGMAVLALLAVGALLLAAERASRH